MYAVVKCVSRVSQNCGACLLVRTARYCKPVARPSANISRLLSSKKLPPRSSLFIRRNSSTASDAMEVIACKVGDLKNGEMKEVEFGDIGKALLIKENDQFTAIGDKCTHHNAPLVKGIVHNGRVRCPWHGACFNAKTGDIEDFPGLDSLPRYEVLVRGSDVIVKAEKQQLMNNRRQKAMVIKKDAKGPGIVIIGGGAASVTCAESLRQNSYSGKITILTMEKHPPYNRTKLSKSMDVTAESIYLRPPEFYEKYGIDVQCKSEVTKLNSAGRSVTLANGNTIEYEQLLIATGGKPRTLPIPGWGLNNVHVLRNPTDANTIASKSVGKRVVVVGASFIGMEVASFLAKGAKSVAICEYFGAPFERVLGAKVGKVFQSMHEDSGIKFYMNASVTELLGEGGNVKKVVLKDGTAIEADIVVAGVGVVPVTDFLKESDVKVDERGFVPVDRHLRTNVPGVYAAGDIVIFPLKMRNWEPANVQHWQMAHYHGNLIGKNMAAKDKSNLLEADSVPFFWTNIQPGKNVRYTGYSFGYDDVVIEGSLEEKKFVAYYCKGDEVVAVATYMCDPKASAIAERWYCGEKILKSGLPA